MQKRSYNMKTVHLNIHDDLHRYLKQVKETSSKTDYNVTITDIIHASIMYFLTDLNLRTYNEDEALRLIRAQKTLYDNHEYMELADLPQFTKGDDKLWK